MGIARPSALRDKRPEPIGPHRVKRCQTCRSDALCVTRWRSMGGYFRRQVFCGSRCFDEVGVLHDRPWQRQVLDREAIAKAGCLRVQATAGARRSWGCRVAGVCGCRGAVAGLGRQMDRKSISNRLIDRWRKACGGPGGKNFPFARGCTAQQIGAVQFQPFLG